MEVNTLYHNSEQLRSEYEGCKMLCAENSLPSRNPLLYLICVHLAPEDFLYSSLKYVSPCINQVVAQSAVSTTVPSHTPHIFLDWDTFMHTPIQIVCVTYWRMCLQTLFICSNKRLKIVWELEDLVSKVCTKSNINFFHCRAYCCVKC